MEAIREQIGRDAGYRDMETDGAARAARNFARTAVELNRPNRRIPSYSAR